MHLIEWSSESGITSLKADVLPVCQGRIASAMILEKQLLLPISQRRVMRPFLNYLKVIILQWERLFLCGKKIKDGCQSFQEWTSQQVPHKVRLWNAQGNCKKPKSCRISQTLQASVSMLNAKLHDNAIRKKTEQVKLVRLDCQEKGSSY